VCVVSAMASKPKRRLGHYLLYELRFERGGATKKYFGITGVFDGQGDWAALQARKQHHESIPVAWVKGARADSLHIKLLSTGLSLPDALVDEARLTARMYQEESGADLVRGGPWCRRVLPVEDKSEIEMTAALTSRAAVRECGRRSLNGSLAAHLAGRTYAAVGTSTSDDPTVVSGPGLAAVVFAAPSAAAMPIAFLSQKRRSGKSGKSSKSGKSGRPGSAAHVIIYTSAPPSRWHSARQDFARAPPFTLEQDRTRNCLVIIQTETMAANN
jgi:hypothetical protein